MRSFTNRPQIDLTNEEYKRIKQVPVEIDRLIKERHYLIKNQKLSEHLYPGGNWNTLDNHNHTRILFDRLKSLKPEYINNFRHYTWPFTGYHLKALSENRETETNIKFHIFEYYINTYYKSIERLPEELIYNPPHKLGETGY